MTDVPPQAEGDGSPENDPFRGPGWSGDDTPVGRPSGSRRRRRTSRRRLRRRRRVGLAMVVVGGIVVLGGIWLLVTGLLARHQLDTIRGEIGTLRTQISAGDLGGARTTARSIASHAHRAAQYTSGPAWSIAAAIPAGGEPIAVVRDITRQTDVLGRSVLPPVISATKRLDPADLRAPNGTIDVARIAAVAPRLHRADTALDSATSSITRQPGTTWLGSVDSARTQFLGDLTSLGTTLHSADLAAHILPPMLGQHGTKRYFVAFENDAEARGTGGQPGAFAIVKAADGHISFERFESDSALTGISATVRFGTDYEANWGNRLPYDQYINSNVSPHFPYAARIWVSMWRAKTGEKLDGALAVDPQALSYLLGATGPARLPDGTAVTSANVVPLTQKDLYARFESGAKANDERKQYLLDIARAVSEQVLHTNADPTALVAAAGRAGVERRLLVYSTSSSVEADLQQTSLSGAVRTSGQPYAGLVVNDAAPNKLDYYLDRSITWKRTGCGSTRRVVVTVRLTNTAPAGLPPYVASNDPSTVPANVARDDVFYYATRGAVISTLEVDGRTQPFYANFERGHPLFGVDILIPRGRTRTITYNLTEPAGTKPPVVLRQPLVRPLHVKVEDQSCG